MKKITDQENVAEQLLAMKAKLLELQKELTLQKGVGVEDKDDGNLGASQELTGEVDYEKQKFAKKKMLVSKMKSKE